MTTIIDKAIAKIRTLPIEDQDVLGAVILALADGELSRIGELDEDTKNAVREGLGQARRGESVPEEDIAALWQRLGL